jgi:hypothetical protein
MRIRRSNNTLSFLGFVLLASLVFFCQGGSLNRILVGWEGTMDMDHHACCDIQDTEGTFVKQILFTLTTKDMGVLAVIALVALYLGSVQPRNIWWSRILYAATVNRGGGWRRFTPLLFLFQRGILHPKIY